MKLNVINNLETLFKHRAQWDAVAGNRAFFRLAWMVNWFEKMRSAGDRLHVLVATDGSLSGAPWLAVAPFFISGRKLRFLGSGVTCTDYNGLFSNLPSDLHEHFATLVAQHIHDEFCPEGALENVDCIELEGCGKLDSQMELFGRLLTERGFKSHEVETEGTWKVRLPDCFDQLDATFSKSMRRKTKAAQKRLAHPDTKLAIATPASFEHFWSVFEMLHQKRRNYLGQLGCFSDPSFTQFLKTATRALVDEKLANLIVLYHSSIPISSALLLYSDNICMFYQSGSDPEFSKMEPGYQINCAAIKSAIGDGCKFFDFLRGDEPYKARWSTTREPILRRKYVPPKLKAQLKHGTWVLGRSIKNYVTGTIDVQVEH